MVGPLTEIERDESGRVRIWDLPVRLFHWALVLSLGASWATAELDMLDWHKRLGYAAIALVLFRILWGLIGSDTARFSRFLKGPGAVLDHVRHLLSREPWRPEVGHNPLGGWAVVALLALVALQAGSGLFTVDDLGFEGGPFFEHVSEDTAKEARRLHFLSFDLLLVMVGVHVAAVALYLLVKKDNLVGPMLTGRRVLPDGTAAPRQAPAVRALACLAVAIAAVWAMLALA
ncbi:MAG TPA: cytochrome b/b6 domain-containing protein [Azospirillaceae bacterium]|nr:cytochrome b/b6 domain-containing protein [Azospirillaceae bacterium]